MQVTSNALCGRLNRTRWAIHFLVVACFCLTAGSPGGSGRAIASGFSCPEIGSTYRPNPEGVERRYIYRLKIEATPLTEDPTGNGEIWQFQMIDRRDRKAVVTLRLREGCPNGGLCSVWFRLGNKNRDVYSEIVRLTDGFEQPKNSAAPKAIILSGFANHPWPPLGNAMFPEDLTYGDPLQSIQLSSDIIWIRSSCGRNR